MPPGVFSAGTWVLFTKTLKDDFSTQGNDQIPRLILNCKSVFGATKATWTFGLPSFKAKK